MGRSYSGCQIVWAFENEKWVPLMMGYFKNGELIRMKFPSQPGHPVERCLKKSGVLIRGDKDTCSAMDVFPYSSAPPQCLTNSSPGDAKCPYD